MESMSGIDLSDVNVHYNSSAPASLNAHAYAQGSDIHLASGQEKHLPHEAWHVVQQKQGRVQPTVQMQTGTTINDDSSLENEATEMGNKALTTSNPSSKDTKASASTSNVVQRFVKVPPSKQGPDNWAGVGGGTVAVSDDGKMAIRYDEVFKGDKVFYAANDVIQDAKDRLEAVSSPYTVARGSMKVQGTIPGTKGWFKPGTAIELSRVIVKKQGTTDKGKSIKTVEACSAHGLDFMGVGTDSGKQKASTRYAGIDVGGGNDIVNTGASVGANVTNDMDARDSILQSIAKLEKGKGPNHPNYPLAKAKEIYKNLSESKRKHYAKMFKINQYAVPEVGDGIEAMRAHGEGAEDSFPMHFAPVVAKSGNDYVTMENYAKKKTERAEGDTSSASNAWYFRMYGTVKNGVDQSYYGQHAKEGSIGTKSSLMGLRNENKAKEE